jgi:Uma2 family endonuclease
MCPLPRTLAVPVLVLRDTATASCSASTPRAWPPVSASKVRTASRMGLYWCLQDPRTPAMPLKPKPQYSFEDWLAVERESAETKSEYSDGEVFAMTGASEAHNLIVMNVGASLNFQMKGRPCRVYASDLKLRIDAANEGRYPDLMALCGDRVYYDGRRDTLLNPALIVEVLSPSTEAYVRGKKSDAYRSVPSLKDLLLLSQHEVRAELYTRMPDGRWLLADYRGLSESVPLESVGCTLALAEVYDKVDLDAE